MLVQGMRSIVVDQDEKLNDAMLARRKTIKVGKAHITGDLKG
jgi:hypothetical protein